MYHLYNYVRRQNGLNKSLFSLSLMILFWALFDGSVSYISPLIAEKLSSSKTLLGFLIGLSSLAGIIFDILICYFIKNTNFRRIYLIMLILCFAQPLILWQANSIFIFILAMLLWGLYFDLYGIGNLDYVGRTTQKENHSSSFGVMRAFHSLGYLLAPLFVSFLIQDKIGSDVFIMLWVLAGLASIFYLTLMIILKNKKDAVQIKESRRRSFFTEIKLWRKISLFIWPVLGINLMFYMIDAFFWTLGPLISEGLSELGKFKGLFLIAYLLPPLFIGWFAGSITNKFGKKRTALISLLTGSIIFIFLPFFSHSYAIISVVFIASFFIALSWPAINGAYADYISESVKIEKEIDGLVDFSTNLGYIIGPIVAGILADFMGNISAFSILGFIVATVSLFLILVTPKEISIKIQNKYLG